MSLHFESNGSLSISDKNGVGEAFLLKTKLLFVLFLSVLLTSQTLEAESPPLGHLNPGLNDAWFNPETDGQGFFITVFPDLGTVSLAWFTYDSELPAEDFSANLGDPGHRWLTALGPIDGNTATLTIFITRGGVFDATEPVPQTDLDGDGTILLEFSDCTAGVIKYDITSLGLSGEIPIQRVAADNIALCEMLLPEEPVACTRSEPDDSHGANDPPVTNGSIVPASELLDGGTGGDGIPAINSPDFIMEPVLGNLDSSELVVGVKVSNDIRAFPHDILNWHEIVNYKFEIDGKPENESATLSYCPLTGSAMLWKAIRKGGDPTFGVSGLLYNSNLVLYDRDTLSIWSQMLEQGIRHGRIKHIPDRLQAVETTWETWLAMYPETILLSRKTGTQYRQSRYDFYPYLNYRDTQSLFFPVNNMNDDRLHRKERVLGINVGNASAVFVIKDFASNVEAKQRTVGDMEVVIAGSSALNFAVVYNRQMEDCTILDFEAVQDQLPVVLRDNEGNEWDVFGTAVSGPRTGQQLQKTNSYIAYWFAWTAFFPGATIN
jgi:hypothetical protein